MRIGCDGRALVGERTGVGVWTARVAVGLAESGVGEVLLAATRPMRLGPDEPDESVQLVPAPRHPTLGPVWLNTTVPGIVRRHRLDCWIGSLAILPLRPPVPSVSVVHDLTAVTHPDRHTLANRMVHRLFLARSLRTAAAIVVVSAATGDEVVRRFPRVEGRVERIPNGVDEWFSPAPVGDDGSEVRRRFTAGRPFILHLGTIEPRKGIPDLVAAWEGLQRVRTDAPDLVIAGKPGWHTEPILGRIRSSTEAGRIHLPGYVERSDARELLRHAEVVVVASEAEGFGLPLAEAISCGTPAVASDIPALREVGGDAALYAPVGDRESLASALTAALEPDTAERLRACAAQRAPELRWGSVIEAWTRLLRRFTDSGRG
jgi:glycosyltransferase involved in cell wall biosynthesis